MVDIRQAVDADADDMVEVQNAIYCAGLRSGPVDIATVRERYLEMSYRIACTVADKDGRVIAFQSLKWAWPDNPYGLAADWGIIGTHVHPEAGRSGLGRRLFEESLAAARVAGIAHIDASIGADNAPALSYYAAMGFAPYMRRGGDIAHRLDLEGSV
ncbi:GNAT family N-acetyltransferase [Leucobacter sp. USCH14]|uniref:GNAT family N-acetyltransferase n=1 Tax=Leucobacter sp. USCH14 TaxID=3024838 RepID=UPI0030AA8950